MTSKEIGTLFQFGTGTVLGIPVIFVIALSLVLIGNFILRKSVFGRMIYAIGNNEEAVRLSGHNTFHYKVAAFTICGAMCFVAVGIIAALEKPVRVPAPVGA